MLHKAGAQASKVCFGTGKSLFKSKCGRTERAQSASCQHSAAPAHPPSQPSSAPMGGENTCPNPLNDPENLGVVIFQTKTQGKRFSCQRGLAELLSSLRLVALCSQHRKTPGLTRHRTGLGFNWNILTKAHRYPAQETKLRARRQLASTAHC